VSFTQDVFPILARAVGVRWVNDLARRGHGQGAAGDLLNPRTLARLASNKPADQPARQRVFARLRNPNLSGADAVRQANLSFMPQLSGDEGFTTNGEPSTWFSVLPHQYEVMRRWAEGDFTADWTGIAAVPQSLAQLPVADQPHALDRAAAQACVGGPFFPGIEMTYISRDVRLYAGPHRLRQDLEPGDVTKRMALPWQADFYDCRTRWWPA
jgi:L-lysine epsilon oxidase C-terminal domain